ncbi:MAG: RNA 2'-phosphotransferase [Fibrobacteres bacterium]|nr:RNA 2'-phosphotransferase [Fibrobacterota bacterium]
MNKNLVSRSKFLSLLLRHAPETIGLSLDAQGWANLSDLVRLVNASGTAIGLDDIYEIVETNEKKRFEISLDDQRIRAVQGHSIEVDLQLEPTTPPELLYHGTARGSVESILAQGIRKGKRQYVHLSQEVSTALQVGGRHGKPVALVVESAKMAQAGHLFYKAKNGVWLTDHVPPERVRTE